VHIPTISKGKAVLLVVAAVAGMAFFYVLFDWTMSVLVHSRKEVMVPDLHGKSLDDAMSLLSLLDLGIKKDGEDFDQALPPGTIVRQNPVAGMMVREGKIIKVVISQGGQTVYVPSVTGQTVRAAEITIRSYGLTLGEESSRYSVMADKDRVISQDPPAGSTVEKDALINLVISAGTPPDNIKLLPNFSGKTIDEARRWSEQNHLNVETVEEKIVGMAPGTVASQDVSPDTDISSVRRIGFVVASAESTAELPGKTFYYEIPQGGSDRQVRLMLLDENGERELFSGAKAPGSKLEIPFAPKGRALIRVFVNGILVEEREVK